MKVVRIAVVALLLTAWSALPSAAQVDADDLGYWTLSIDGGVFSFGGAHFHGAPGPAGCTVQPVPGSGFEPGTYYVCSDIAAVPGGGGYWVVDRFCHVIAFGNADHHGQRISTRDLRDSFGNCKIAADPSDPNGGYWLANDGGDVFAFGSAEHHGDLIGDPGDPGSGVPGDHQAVVGLVPTPTGNGYWLVTADGGVFTFGDAEFHGSLGGVQLNSSVVGATAAPGGGYWLTSLDGGVFSFGSATFHGSLGGVRLNEPVWGMDASPTGHGYRLVAADGGVFTFGDATFGGSMGGQRLNAPMVAITASS